jgi:hypothetical protein
VEEEGRRRTLGPLLKPWRRFNSEALQLGIRQAEGTTLPVEVGTGGTLRCVPGKLAITVGEDAFEARKTGLLTC